MKLAFLALMVVLILGGGAAGAYFYFQQPAEAAIGENGDHKEAKEAKEAKGGHGVDASEANKHEFVELSPLVLPIVDQNGVSQTVIIVVVIEVGSDKDAGKVRNLEPRLKDAFIQDLYGVLNKHAALRGGVLQVGVIKKRLGSISNRVMGDDVVKDVLLQVVQQRPI